MAFSAKEIILSLIIIPFKGYFSSLFLFSPSSTFPFFPFLSFLTLPPFFPSSITQLPFHSFLFLDSVFFHLLFSSLFYEFNPLHLLAFLSSSCYDAGFKNIFRGVLPPLHSFPTSMPIYLPKSTSNYFVNILTWGEKLKRNHRI